MTSYSPLVFKPECFDPSAVPPEPRAFNSKQQGLTLKAPNWKEIGAAEYRRLRTAGKTPRPGATHLPSATGFELPSRDPGRSIPCRILGPQNNKPVNAVFMHLHGGGWVLGDETYQDPMLQAMANDHEYPFLAGPQDCYDVEERLVVNADGTFNAPLGFIGGESAGAHLSLLVVLHLLQHKKSEFSDCRLKGVLLHFGCYSLDWTPSVYNYRRGQPPLVLSMDLFNDFRNAFLPGWSQEMLKDLLVSPLFASLEQLMRRAPPALFTCGTEDYHLDDTLFDGAEVGMQAADDFIASKVGLTAQSITLTPQLH
ncbi:Alpha/Beta hydrolase protein [Dactylonectria macrodidyma]|uniref:Alpha/Beta hydrolase protein n=1 Tax=Dactylonectria macrodidyma TaxID=307937 RepID=A0A9P9IF13_9HYPO|nr:Alpha/Beta hydrolase protein [Dactylonectria macrodidyma]